MAKNRASTTVAEGFAPDEIDETTPGFSIPEGFEEITTDIVGTWEPTEHQVIECTPLYVSASDSTIEETKPSVLITCRAGRNPVKVVTKDGEETDTTEGCLFGVWFRSGMRNILECADATVLVVRDGEVKIKNKPNDMIRFRVFAKKGTPKKTLELRFDWRKQSKHAPLPAAFLLPRPERVGNPGAPIASESENEPFTDQF